MLTSKGYFGDKKVIGPSKQRAFFFRAALRSGESLDDVMFLYGNVINGFANEGATNLDVSIVFAALAQSFIRNRIIGEEFRALSECSTSLLRVLSSRYNMSISELKVYSMHGLLSPRSLIDDF